MARTNPYARVAVQLLAVGPHPAVGVDRVAVAAPIDGHPAWLLALLFRVGGGSTDLMTHAVMPRPDDWPTAGSDTLAARQWLTRWVGTVPEQSDAGSRLTTVVVRSAVTSELERWARRYVAGLQGFLVAPGAAGDPMRKPRGPRGGGDRRYALMAQRYLELCTDGVTEAPVTELAKEWSLARATVQSYLHRARERGLLTSRGRGLPGGTLTPRALALIDEEGDDDGEH